MLRTGCDPHVPVYTLPHPTEREGPGLKLLIVEGPHVRRLGPRGEKLKRLLNGYGYRHTTS